MKSFHRFLPDGFRLRLSVLFGGLFLLATVLDIFHFDRLTLKQQLEDKGSELHAVAQSMSAAIAANLQDRHREIIHHAEIPGIANSDWPGETLSFTVRHMANSFRHYGWVSIVRLDGTRIATSSEASLPASVINERWFHGGRDYPSVDSGQDLPLPAANTPQYHRTFLYFQAPVRNLQGRLRGKLIAQMQCEWIKNVIVRRLPPESLKQGLEVFIVDHKGRPLFKVGRNETAGPSTLPVAQGRFVSNWADGQRYLHSTVVIPDTDYVRLGWRVVVRQPQERAIANFEKLRATFFWQGLLFTAVLMFAVYQVAALISRPIERLAQASRRMANGEIQEVLCELDIKVRTREGRQLAEAFNILTQNLLSRQQALTEVNNRLETLVNERTAELTEANRQLASKACLLEQLARSDALTGVGNRLAAEEWLLAEWQRFQRNHEPYSVLLLDADHFKLINDRWGHSTGDQVLQQIASTLHTALRASDRLARYGGEEFLMLLPGTDLHGANTLAERVRASTASQPHPVAGTVTLSIGIATIRAGDTAPDSVVNRADEALYRAKREGRNRIEVADNTDVPPAPPGGSSPEQ